MSKSACHVFHDSSEVFTLQMPWMIPPSLNSAAALAAQCGRTCGEMLHCYADLPLPVANFLSYGRCQTEPAVSCRPPGCWKGKLPMEIQNRGHPNSTDHHLMVGSTNSIFALLPIVMPELFFSCFHMFSPRLPKFLKVQGPDWEC